MNKVSRDRIEKIKNIILVVLFLSTILLLYFFWEDIELSEIKISDFAFEELPLERTVFPEDLILPSYFLTSFGDDEYTVERDVRATFLEEGGFVSALNKFLTESETFVEEITKEQYAEVYKYQSVKAVFEYALPYGEFFSFFGIKSPAASEMNNLTEIGFSKASETSVFIYDKNSEKYYRITGEYPVEYLDKYFSAVETSEYFYYYPLNTYVGSDINSDILLPIYKASDMVERKLIVQDMDDELKVAERNKFVAKTYFGNNFDFVRKIEESDGKVIYMYGYAEKVLIADIDGSVEYKDDTAQRTNNLTYIEALDEALKFAEEHDAFYSRANAETIVPYIKSAQINPQGKRGYRFEIGFKLSDNAIFSEKSSALVIEVINGTVRYFYMNVPSVEKEDLEDDSREAFSAINTIAKNYEYIGGFITATDENKGKRERITIETVCDEITTMQSGYYQIQDTLRPCWLVGINGYDKLLCFDLYTADPVQ